jgi:acylphosphatase
MQSGEAAEQTLRLAMDGAEFVLKIAGGGAERIAAFLAAAMQSQGKAQKQPGTKLRGRERLKAMLKSGRELKIFEIQGKDLKEFAAAAKKYGLAYCVLRNKNQPDGMVELMAKAEDAPKISRILERLESRDLGTAQVEPGKTKAELNAEKQQAMQKMRGEVVQARKASRQQFTAKRKPYVSADEPRRRWSVRTFLSEQAERRREYL